MFYREVHQKSQWPKSLIILTLMLSLFVSADILLSNQLGLHHWNNPYRTDGDLIRGCLLLTCLFIYIFRVAFALAFHFHRIMFWKEAVIVSSAMPFCLIHMAYYGGLETSPVGLPEIAGSGLFILGSYLNSASEYSRNHWKRDRANAGKLYTKGLFTHVRHINYSGDVVLFFGIVLITREPLILLIPAGMAAIFLFILIPLKERYLRQRYGKAFEIYAGRSKKLIPLVL